MTEQPEPPPGAPRPARSLAFPGSEAILAEVDHLLEAGYERTGGWTLAQICHHLADALIASVEGFPGFTAGGDAAANDPEMARRVALGRRLILERGEMPRGVKLPDEFAPRADLDDRAEAEALRGAWRAYHQHLGTLAAHPLLGPLTRDEWMRFHCVHAAHHLGFLMPRSA